MSGGIGDMVSHLECDISDYVAPIEEAADVTEETGERTLRVIHEQEAGWRSMVMSVGESVAEMSKAILGFAGSYVGLIKQRELLSFVSSNWLQATSMAIRYGSTAARIAGVSVPPLAAAAAAITAVTVAYKVGSSEIVQEAVKQTDAAKAVSVTYDHVVSSVDHLQSALSKLGSEGFQFVEQTVGRGVEFLLKYEVHAQLIQFAVKAAAAELYMMGDRIEMAAKATEEVSATMSTAVYVTSSWGTASAESTAQFYEEGKALQQLAEQTEQLIAKQEAQRASFAGLRGMQEEATAAAAHSAEVARLGSLTSVAAIEDEQRALQVKAAELIRTGKYTEEEQRRVQQLFNTLANQKQGVQSGRVKPEDQKETYATSQMQAAEQALLRLEHGEIAAALATAKMKGATDEEVSALRTKLEQVDAAKAAMEALRAAEQAANQETQRRATLQQQGEDRIASLRDQIDLLNGAATEGEIAMRELFRQGLDENQIAEIGALTDELDKLREKSPKEKRQGENQAALKGTSEQAALLLRGVGAGPEGRSEELLKQILDVGKQQYLVTKKGVTVTYKEED